MESVFFGCYFEFCRHPLQDLELRNLKGSGRICLLANYNVIRGASGSEDFSWTQTFHQLVLITIFLDVRGGRCLLSP